MEFLCCHFANIIFLHAILIVGTIKSLFVNIALAGNRFLHLFLSWLIGFWFLAHMCSRMLEFFTFVLIFLLVIFLTKTLWNRRSLSSSAFILVTRILLISNIIEKLSPVRLHGRVQIVSINALKIHIYFLFVENFKF